jgi:hypothetical protein
MATKNIFKLYSRIFSINPEELEGNVHKMKMKEIGRNLLHRHLQRGSAKATQLV